MLCCLSSLSPLRTLKIDLFIGLPNLLLKKKKSIFCRFLHWCRGGTFQHRSAGSYRKLHCSTNPSLLQRSALGNLHLSCPVWRCGAASLFVLNFFTFLLYINVFTEPIKTLIDFTEQFQNGYSGFERFMGMISVVPDIKDAPDAQPMQEVKGEISFENVSFHYADSDQMVLNHVNLEVPAGEYVALVGSSGAGKSTLCSLIPRFYDVTGGTIRVDGQDIRKIKLSDLRNHIGIVQQDVYLFAGTILENIRYGKPDASREEVIKAAKEANAHEFIMSFPDGYDTDIGQRGVKLSGGQKQRLSIARVFLKNPPILIFDEATSALDNESEKVVQESLEILAKGRTTFVIAHRLSTIRNAERILVLTENGIEESGTHEELVAKGGIYQKLCEMANLA